MLCINTFTLIEQQKRNCSPEQLVKLAAKGPFLRRFSKNCDSSGSGSRSTLLEQQQRSLDRFESCCFRCKLEEERREAREFRFKESSLSLTHTPNSLSSTSQPVIRSRDKLESATNNPPHRSNILQKVLYRHLERHK